MNVRYAPGALKRIHEYRADLRIRVEAGVLSHDEMVTLLATKMREETAGGDARKVRCPSCGNVLPIFGRRDTFACECSPETKRSVWDYRVIS